MGYDTWKTTDFEHERKCAIEEADEKNRRDAAADLFDNFNIGDESAIDEVMDMLDDTGRWQDVIEALRAAYYRPGESHADKALRVFLAYQSAMDDVCLRIADGAGYRAGKGLPADTQRQEACSAPQPYKRCSWWREPEEMDGNDWVSDCGASFSFIDDGPVINGFHHCPKCGRKLSQLPPEKESN